MRCALLGLALLAGSALAQAPAQQWEPYSAGLQSRATAGDANAQFVLGEAYRTGNGIPADREQAITWYRKASATDPRAADALGVLLFTKGERKQAIPLLQAAAGRRNEYALYILGTARFNGDYVPKDIARAYADMRLAAATLPQAQRSLGLMESYVTSTDRQRADQLAAQVGGPEAGAPGAPAYALAPPPVMTPPIAKVRVPAPTAVAPSVTTALPDPTTISVKPSAQPAAPYPVNPPALQVAPPPASTTVSRSPTAEPPLGSMAVTGNTPAPIRTVDLPPSRPAMPTSPPSTVATQPSIVPPPSTLPQRPTTVPASVPKASPTSTPPSPAAGGWRIQLGAYGSEDRATTQWTALSGKVPALAKLRKVTQPAGSGSLVRLQATGLASRDEATALCQTVTAAGGPCLVLGPATP